MDEKVLTRNAYKRMYDGMIAKDEEILREVLDDSFVLVHMTGMQQPKEEFIRAVLNGTLNYYSAEHENLPVEINGDTAVLTGQSYVAAAVFGGGRSNWHLQHEKSKRRMEDHTECGINRLRTLVELGEERALHISVQANSPVDCLIAVRLRP